jgi:hypothetical protein
VAARIHAAESERRGNRVDFDRANSIGTGGERLVAETLQRLSLRYDFRQLDNVVLKVGKATSQIDHLVVDPFGIVIIESKVRNAAHIKGQDGEKNWTACYPGGKSKPFQNPLRQNQWHDTALRQVLKDADITLEPDYIDTLVVFVGADLSGLSLRDAERQRVLDVGQLEAYFAMRARKAEDRPSIVAPFVQDLLVTIARADKSRDDPTMAAHAAHRAGKRQPTVGSSAEAAAKRKALSDLDRWKRAHPQEAGSRSEGSSSSTYYIGLPAGLARLVVGILAIALLYLAVTSGAVDQGLRLLSAFLAPASTASPSATSGVAAGPTLAVAKQRLNELAPDVYAAASDLDSPKIASRTDGTAFTWHYLSKPKPNTAFVRTFTLVLGPDGSMRSMGASK